MITFRSGTVLRRYKISKSIKKLVRQISSKGEQNLRVNIEYGEELQKRGLGIKQANIQDASRAVLNHSPNVRPNNDYISTSTFRGSNRKVYIETYGCQMNVNDVEIVSSILIKNGFILTKLETEADVILLATCSIREGAEKKIWNRLNILKKLKKKNKTLKIGILGCMVTRLKEKIFEKSGDVDVICGPDSYKDLPRLLFESKGQYAANVQLSFEETYADVIPVRTNPESCSAFISIMRGCDNMCTYCIVPFTRGRERSRPIASIIEEVKVLSDQGIREITLLGQNVNSYRDMSESTSYGGFDPKSPTKLSSDDFKTVYKPKIGGRRFCDLLDHVSAINPEIRIRFTSPHPKDFPIEVLQMIKERNNICNQIHLPAQSGSDKILNTMGRGYTRQAYLSLVRKIREEIPDIAFTSDFIAGFCGEDSIDHQETLSLIEEVQYHFIYCFPYSMREKTRAYHRLSDDISLDVKKSRVKQIVDTFRGVTLQLHSQAIGSKQLVLIEGESKRSKYDMAGRNDAGTKVILRNDEIPSDLTSRTEIYMKPGDYVVAQILDCSSQVLKGVPLYHTTLQDFYSRKEIRKTGITAYG